MLETADEIADLQRLLDRSAASAGAHLRGIITGERRLGAEGLCRRLQGMRPLTVATVTADGRPLAGPVDGYFLHGTFWFGSGRGSVRMRHLAARPAVSATHTHGEALAVTVHGRAELFEIAGPECAELRRAMLDHYLPLQGPRFETWLDELDGLAARIEPEKMFTFHLDERAEPPAAGAGDLIGALELEAHPEGGHYRETWSDGASSAIYFLLRAGERSAWHRVRDRAEIWHFYAGAPLELQVDGRDHPGAAPDTVVLGPQLGDGQRPQAVVPPGAWQRARSLGEWTLVGCTVAPPFTFDAFDLAEG